MERGDMAIRASIREVFGRFQNLNLLVLLEDLRQNQAARHGWSFDGQLCPIAHGLPTGRQGDEVAFRGHAAGLEDDCDHAAHLLGASPAAVLRFVRSWDEGSLGHTWLLQQLEALWLERPTDAEAVQSILSPQSSPLGAEVPTPGAFPSA